MWLTLVAMTLANSYLNQGRSGAITRRPPDAT